MAGIQRAELIKLDDVSEFEALDSLGMLEAAASLPEQCEAAVESARAARAHDAAEITNIVIFGMGGSAMGGRVLAAFCFEHFSIPVRVVEGYTAPGWLGPNSLVFAISYSGDTEETLEATRGAIDHGAHVVCVTSGGELEAIAQENDLPLVMAPKGLQPRAALGSLAMPAITVLEEMGLAPGFEHDRVATLEQLRARREMIRPEVPLGENPAKRLAHGLLRTIPLVYGGGHIGGAAALRFKCQVNENAKSPAFWNVYPELDHNEIVGWGQHGDATRQLFKVVELRHDFEHPQVRKRFEATRELMGECVAGFEEVNARGDNPLSQLFDLIYICDYASLYMALAEGVDPGPVEAIDRLKAIL